MSVIYHILETVLPFEWMQYDFMKNAFIAILIITPLFGILGTMIVNNRMAFFSEALGHSAFTGIAVGVLFGLTNTTLSMVIFAIVFALFLNRIKRLNTVSTDTIISVFASLATSIGLVILSKGGNFSKYSNLLVGDILSITTKEILMLLGIFVVTILFWLFAFNKLHALSVNQSLAKSRGIRVVLIDNLFVVLIALIVMLSIKWVGILIINALLILPAAASRNISDDMREYHLYSILIAIFSGVLGLVLSYYNSTATGPTIVIISSIIFFATLICRPIFKK
ncbi:MAG: metal ABC transporter permease [bacterium]|nr:metal ABC transporter permease [bacterium]